MTHDEVVKALRGQVKDGVVKTKGAYECLPYDELGWHKNHSSMVIQMAVAAHLLGLCDYKTFIENHRDPYDFCLRTKVPRSCKLFLVTTDEFGSDEEQIQNICRYIPVVNGGKLVKEMPPLKGREVDGPRRMSIDSEWNVKPCNNMQDFVWDLDYNYYLTKCEKLINAIGLDDEEDDE